MARRLSIYTIVGLALIVSTPYLTAGPLKATHLPDDAKWVIHVDYEAFTDSALAERIRTKRPKLVKKVHKWFSENCGLDPQKDIQSITLFSDKYKPHSGAAVACGKFDEEKVESLLKKKRDVKQTEAHGHTFYTWKIPPGHKGFKGEHIKANDTAVEDAEVVESPKADKKSASHAHGARHEGDHEVTAVLIDGQQAVIAGSLERAKEVVELLQGNGNTLDSDSELLKNMSKDAIVYGAAIELGSIDQHARPFPILKQHKRIQWILGERDDEMFETLVLVANRPKTAREMEKVMEGLLALGKVWAGDLKTLASLYEDTEIDRDGTTVTVEWEGPVEDVMTALDELKPRIAAWKKYHKEMHH